MPKNKTTRDVDPLTTLALAEAHARRVALGLCKEDCAPIEVRVIAWHIRRFMRRTEQIAAKGQVVGIGKILTADADRRIMAA